MTRLRENLNRARLRMTHQANKRRKDVEFAAGDWVLVKLHTYRQKSVRGQRCSKLAKRFYGPFQVTIRIGPVAYKLRLPENAKIHDVFHVSLLKRCRNPQTEQAHSWPECFNSTEAEVIPEQILAVRQIKRAGRWVEQVLVKWRQYVEEDATWEDKTTMTQQYPELNLEVEVALDGGGNVTSHAGQVQLREQDKLGRGERQKITTRRFDIEG